MIDFLKDIALTIMAVGFGLAVLFPVLLNMFVAIGMMAIVHTTNWKDTLIQYSLYIVTVLATIAFGAYYAITIYYIWIY
ncbi:hypothetical protein XbC2_104 [Xanthomonas phage XbC2]|nr:hypothetical protein XbC2_104 [Xanthomonas phage XbC2]